MAKAKIKRHSTNIDMTAMCDVAFLLLTFFMLTAKAKPVETVTIDTPSSISDTKLPDSDVMTLSVDTKGRAYFNVDNPKYRRDLILKVNTDYALNLSEKEMQAFTRLGSIGVPRAQLKKFLSLEGSEQAKLEVPGVPADTANNELNSWIDAARRVSGNTYRIVVKADGQAEYPGVSRVISTLQSLNINKFNLITDLEANPNKTTALIK
jgi:biopolymer transport protein ExbD